MLNPDYRDMLSAFSECGVEFLVVGAYALAAHGLPRATGDIDLWIAPSDENAKRVHEAIVRFGAPTFGWTSEDFRKPEMVYQIGVEPRRIDIITSIRGVEFSQAWSRRIVLQIDGLEIPFLNSEDLIASKVAAGRPQDLADVARLKKQRSKLSQDGTSD